MSVRRGHAGRVDANHKAIVESFRKSGVQVTSLAQLGSGVPDLLILLHGKVQLVEVKTPKGKLKPDQVKFHSLWPVHVVTSEADVEELITKGRVTW